MNDTNANTTTNGGGNSNSANNNNNNNNNNEYQYADFDPNAITASLFEEEEEGRDDDNVDDLVEVGRNTNNGGGGGGGSDDDDNDNVLMMSRFAATDNNHNMEAIDEEQTTEFDHPRHQGEMMAMMEEYSDDNDGVGVGGDNDRDRDEDVLNVNGNTNDDDDDNNRENYDATTTTTTTMMDTSDSNKIASSSSCQTSVDGVDGDRRPFQRRRNGNLQIDTSSSNGQHPSWLGAVKDVANNSSSNDDENGGEEQEQEQEQRGEKGLEPSNQNQQEQASSSSSSSSETTDLIQDISEKLDDKLNNTRLLAKKLLQEITVYVQSLEQVENKYSRIVELENNESLRLDVVEPEVSNIFLPVVVVLVVLVVEKQSVLSVLTCLPYYCNFSLIFQPIFSSFLCRSKVLLECFFLPELLVVVTEMLVRFRLVTTEVSFPSRPLPAMHIEVLVLSSNNNNNPFRLQRLVGDILLRPQSLLVRRCDHNVVRTTPPVP